MGPGMGPGMGPVRSSMGPRLYLTPPSAGTSPAAEFKELRSCPPRGKERVQPWEGDVLDVDLALILFLQLVCSGVFFLNLLDHLVTLPLRAARFEANLGHAGTFSEPLVLFLGSRGVLCRSPPSFGTSL